MNPLTTLSVARRNMLAGKARTAFSIGGVAVATLLLVFVVGLYRGWNDGLVEYIRKTDADIWVVGSGADSFFTPSIVFNTTVAYISQTEGVEKATPLIGRPLNIRLHEGDKQSWESYVIGYDPAAPGGPVRIKEGASSPGRGEIIIDDVLARTAGVGVGDTVRISRRDYTIAGISEGGNLVLAQLSFVNKEDGRLLIGLDQLSNFVLVKADPGQVDAVINRINSQFTGVNAIPSEKFADNSQAVLHRSILPILFVIVIMSVIVGTVVVGLTVYTAVVEKEREFGILKAIGVPGPGLLRVVFEQSLVSGLLGFALGLGLAFAVSAVANSILPQVVTLFRWQDILLVLAAAAGMSFVAGFIPMQRVLRVDALSVFKA